MTIRGVTRLSIYMVATVTIGVALFIREALRDIGRAVRLP